MSATPNVVVLIVNYRSVDHLDACIASLAAEDVGAIHVLDNGSGRHELDALEALREVDGRLRIHVSLRNLGFGGGVNRLVELARPAQDDYLWVLNPDTVVRPGAARSMSASVASDPRALWSPLLVTGSDDSMRVWFAGGDVDVRRGRVVHHWAGSPVDDLPVKPQTFTFVTGAALMCTARTFKTLNGFREDLFLYWEDADLSLRAAAQGRGIRVCRDAIVWHREGGSSEVREGRGVPYYRYMARNRLLVCAPSSSVVGLVAGRGAPATARLLFAPILRERHGRAAKALAAFRGTLEGAAAASPTWRRAARAPRERADPMQEVHG